eukprot:8883686-Lingulodinium_polyedra.AAC.1
MSWSLLSAHPAVASRLLAASKLVAERECVRALIATPRAASAPAGASDGWRPAATTRPSSASMALLLMTTSLGKGGCGTTSRLARSTRTRGAPPS